MRTDGQWFYVETQDSSGRNRAVCVFAEHGESAQLSGITRHLNAHKGSSGVKVTASHAVTAEKAQDIQRYMEDGDWQGWPLGVGVSA